MVTRTNSELFSLSLYAKFPLISPFHHYQMGVFSCFLQKTYKGERSSVLLKDTAKSVKRKTRPIRRHVSLKMLIDASSIATLCLMLD